MRDNEKSLRLFNDYISAQPKSPYINVAKISKGILLIESGKVDEAYTVFDALRNVGDNGIRAKANIYLGELNSNKKIMLKR
ncbi:hypothetical protein MASR2M39_05710 [Ignavibacteriales bacterium]